MNTVRQLLQQKSVSEAPALPASTPVKDALNWLDRNHLEAAPVVEGGQLAGIVTETACALELARHPEAARAKRVGEIMDSHPEVIEPERSYEECAEVMTRSATYHLPVVEGGYVIGMISMRDVMEALMFEQRDTIQFLEELMTDYDPV